MVDTGAILPGALEPDRFFGRIEELRQFRREARMLARAAGRSRVICARPGAGKTELLRQWHGRLFLEGEILPFWYSVPRAAAQSVVPCDEFIASLALQALAFKRRDPSLLARALSRTELTEGLRATWGDGCRPLAESLAGSGARGPQALASMALAPHRFAARTGTRVLCLVDDAGNFASVDGAHPWPDEATASTIAPVVFTIEDDLQMPELFGPAAASLVTFGRLAPLSPEAASRLARQLARTAGLELGEQEIEALARESAGSPFYMGALVRALGECRGTGAHDVARAAAAALCEGELSRYWLDRFAGAIPDRRTRASALEVLTFCLKDGEEGPDAGRLAAQMLKPETDVEAALAGLSRAGVIRVDCARVVVDEDPVLRDVVRALYRREFGRVAPAAVVASLAADKVRNAPAAGLRLQREAFRGALRGLFGAWSGQQVPSVLFDSTAFHAGHGGRNIEDVIAGLAGEPETITLPRVVSVMSGRVGSGVSLPGLEVDALAWALRAEAGTPEADVAWTARLLHGGSSGAGEIEQFDRDIVALQGSGDLPAARLVRWAILETPLDAGGDLVAARLRISTSTWPQLEILAKLLGVTIPVPPSGRGIPVTPALEMEMTIPRVADVELVAARALEQLAENLAIDSVVIGRLKVALVEACINAFEYGDARDPRVRLVFKVVGGRLVLRVENRGRPLDVLPPAAATGRESRGRGWGLSLIRELVDEVALEPREDGVSLLMVKQIGVTDHG